MQMNTRSRRGLYNTREELWSSCRLCPMIQGCTMQPTFFYRFKNPARAGCNQEGTLACV